jgi:hypothetical protein
VRRRAPICVAGLLLAAVTVLSAAVPVGAGEAVGDSGAAAVQQPEDDPDGDPSTDDAPLPGQDMIPEPNSGRPPSDAGDRGGVLQGLVLLCIVIGVGGIAVLAVRESRRARARRVAGTDVARAAVEPGVTTDHRHPWIRRP